MAITIFALKDGFQRLAKRMTSGDGDGDNKFDIPEGLSNYVLDLTDESNIDEVVEKMKEVLEPYELEIECPDCGNLQPRSGCCLFCGCLMTKKESKKVEKKEEVKETKIEVAPELSEKQKDIIYGVDLSGAEDTIKTVEALKDMVETLPAVEAKTEPQTEPKPKKQKEPKEIRTPQVFEGFRAGSKAALLYDAICNGKDIDTIVADWMSQFGGDVKKHKAMVSQYVSNWKNIYGMKIDKRENRYFFIERPC